MDERRLRYFLAVVEEGGVTSAAARLHIRRDAPRQITLVEIPRALLGEI